MTAGSGIWGRIYHTLKDSRGEPNLTLGRFQMRVTYNGASFLLMGASILAALVVGGIWGSLIGTFWVMATLYTAALAAYAKGKGRSFAWALWGALPVIGWIVLGQLRDHAAAQTEAPDGLGAAIKGHRSSVVFIRGVIVSIVGGTLCTFCILPKLVFMQAWPNARRLVQPIEAHRQTHGIYPDSLGELAAAQEPRIPLDAIHYSTHNDALEFYLVVTSWDERVSYDSRTGKWKFGR